MPSTFRRVFVIVKVHQIQYLVFAANFQNVQTPEAESEKSRRNIPATLLGRLFCSNTQTIRP